MDGIDYSLFSGFRLLDVIDIILVAIIIYYIYSLIRGTIAVNILIGVALFYGVYIVVKQMHMRLLTEIFGGFIRRINCFDCCIPAGNQAVLTTRGKEYIHETKKSFLVVYRE